MPKYTANLVGKFAHLHRHVKKQALEILDPVFRAQSLQVFEHSGISQRIWLHRLQIQEFSNTSVI